MELSRLAAAIEHDEETTRKLIHNMMDRYAQEGRGVRIIGAGGFLSDVYGAGIFTTTIIKGGYQPKKQVLTDVLLETLSIVASKQPVTRLEIEKIRGVKSDHAVNRLVEYNLICEVGRLDAPGRPLLFGTTEEFLRSFGVQSLDDLPVVAPEQVADFKGRGRRRGTVEIEFINLVCCLLLEKIPEILPAAPVPQQPPGRRSPRAGCGWNIQRQLQQAAAFQIVLDKLFDDAADAHADPGKFDEQIHVGHFQKIQGPRCDSVPYIR